MHLPTARELNKWWGEGGLRLEGNRSPNYMRKGGRHNGGREDTGSPNSGICIPLNFLFRELGLEWKPQVYGTSW